jgi:NADH:ubiquinone oxidoreductase subunit 5 (subunit L)/multisubunit Na+/H+ antiporter MnhA subunit
MLVNRVGDLALLIGISIIFFNFLTLKYIVIFNLINYLLNFSFILFNMNFNLITLISLFLFFGAMGKSAQLGLHM